MKTSSLFEIYEDFARSIYEKTGCNEEIEIIVPKSHYIKLVSEMIKDHFHSSVAKKYPAELKILTTFLTFKITYNYSDFVE